MKKMTLLHSNDCDIQKNKGVKWTLRVFCSVASAIGMITHREKVELVAKGSSILEIVTKLWPIIKVLN